MDEDDEDDEEDEDDEAPLDAVFELEFLFELILVSSNFDMVESPLKGEYTIATTCVVPSDDKRVNLKFIPFTT